MAIALFSTLGTAASLGQSASVPRDYRTPEVRVDGASVTPVPNAAFTARVDILSRQKSDDGTLSTRTTSAVIARDSSGRIYNERHALVAAGIAGDPPLLSAHIYDPETGSNIFLDPRTHLARETVRKRPAVQVEAGKPADSATTEEDIGTQQIGSLIVHGVRKSRTIPAALSGTGEQVVVTDEYWFSPELSMYMVIKHNDPRTGEQTVGISEVSRQEPPATRFAVPVGYKVVDETPPE